MTIAFWRAGVVPPAEVGARPGLFDHVTPPTSDAEGRAAVAHIRRMSANRRDADISVLSRRETNANAYTEAGRRLSPWR